MEIIESRDIFNNWVISSLNDVSDFGEFDFSHNIIHLVVDSYYLSIFVEKFIKERLNKKQIVYFYQEDKEYHYYFQDTTETKYYWNRVERELKHVVLEGSREMVSFLDILGQDTNFLVQEKYTVYHIKKMLYSFNKNHSFRAEWSYFDIFNEIIVQYILNQEDNDFSLLEGIPDYLIDHIFKEQKTKVSSLILRKIILINNKEEYVKYLDEEAQKEILPFII